MTVRTKPTKEQFHAYQQVQQSGATNMWAIDYVCDLALMNSGVILNKEECFYIMKHYTELVEEYGDARNS